MNILFVRLSYIGDILHATAAARWIKEQYPQAVLHWIVTPSMAELLEHNPYVDHIIPWERDVYEAHSKKLHLMTMWRMWWDLRDKLKPYHFDIAVDVQGRLITGLVLLASGAPIRLGLGGTKELNWLFTNYKSNRKDTHVIKQYVEVAQLLSKTLPVVDKRVIDPAISAGDANVADTVNYSLFHYRDKSLYDMDLVLTADEKEVANETIESEFSNQDVPTIGVVLGSSWSTKEWPSDKWKQFITSMAYRANFICFGGPKEAVQYKDLMDELKSERMPVYNALGGTTLREMAALIQACDVVVSADTGALHIANALKRPVVALFGPTNPKEWGPLTGKNKVLQNTDIDCLGCRKRKCPKDKVYCMSGIDPVRVKAATLALLN